MDSKKKAQGFFNKLVKKAIDDSLVIDTLGTTCFYYYQPKAPKGLDKFKIKKND